MAWYEGIPADERMPPGQFSIFVDWNRRVDHIAAFDETEARKIAEAKLARGEYGYGKAVTDVVEDRRQQDQ